MFAGQQTLKVTAPKVLAAVQSLYADELKLGQTRTCTCTGDGGAYAPPALLVQNRMMKGRGVMGGGGPPEVCREVQGPQDPPTTVHVHAFFSLEALRPCPAQALARAGCRGSCGGTGAQRR